jgi:hypothetical protein
MKAASLPLVSVDVDQLHQPHPQIRAEDWRSPLVLRLLGSKEYRDGSKLIHDSYRAKEDAPPMAFQLDLRWSGLDVDFKKCVNTYQEYRLTEYSALGLACILVDRRASLEITEVTRLGQKTDYWLGKRELMLEVSGQQSGSLDYLCSEKAQAVKTNPFQKDGYVCVVDYETAMARLWFFKHPHSP